MLTVVIKFLIILIQVFGKPKEEKIVRIVLHSSLLKAFDMSSFVATMPNFPFLHLMVWRTSWAMIMLYWMSLLGTKSLWRGGDGVFYDWS